MGWITKNDLVAYLGGGFGEGNGTTFLEINRVRKVFECFNRYILPNLEETERKEQA